MKKLWSARVSNATYQVHGNRPGGSGEEDLWRVFTIYGDGGPLDHVTILIRIYFHFFPTMSFQMKFTAIKKKKKKKSHFFTFSNWKTYWTKFIFCLDEAIYIQKSCIKQHHWLNIVNRYLHGCNSVKVSTMFHCFPIVIPKWRNLTLE